MDALINSFQAIFDPIVNGLGWILRYFHYNIGMPWWVSIAVLTVIVRFVLFPLTIRQVKSMRAMQELRPEFARYLFAGRSALNIASPPAPLVHARHQCTFVLVLL